MALALLEPTLRSPETHLNREARGGRVLGYDVRPNPLRSRPFHITFKVADAARISEPCST